LDQQQDNATWTCIGGEEPTDEALELLADWLLELVDAEAEAEE
jgi:hypothetical protein